MAETTYSRIQMRRRTAAEWTALNEILKEGEIGVVTDVIPQKLKIGNGLTEWNLLDFVLDNEALQEAINSLSNGQINAEIGVAPPSNITIANVSAEGTYTYYGGAIVSSGDLSSGLVQLRKVGSVWTKVITPIPLGAYVQKVDAVSLASTSSVLKNGIADKPGTYTVKTTLSVPTFISGSGINPTTGALTASASNFYTDYVPIPVGHSHLRVKMLVSSVGGAFYDSSNVFIAGSGFLGTGISTDYPVPTGAAYSRTSRHNSLTAAEATPSFVNLAVVPENYTGYFRDGVMNLVFGLTSERFNWAEPNTYVGEKAILNKPGQYIVKRSVLLTKFTSAEGGEAGGIGYNTGNEIAAGGFFRTDFIATGDYNKIITTIPNSSAGSIVFYNASNTYISGQYGTTGLRNSYDINTLPEVKYFRASTNTGFSIELVKDFYLYEGETAIINNGIVSLQVKDWVYQPQVTISDLPVSDGTDITVGDAYIDDITGSLKIKI